MNTRRKNHIAILFLLLTLVFSTPGALLHSCGELHHEHDELSIHAPHAACMACDLKTDPAEQADEQPEKIIRRQFAATATARYIFQFSDVPEQFTGRAPPVPNFGF